jgi:hypothetical protein
MDDMLYQFMNPLPFLYQHALPTNNSLNRKHFAFASALSKTQQLSCLLLKIVPAGNLNHGPSVPPAVTLAKSYRDSL